MKKMCSFEQIENVIKNEKREKHGVEGMILGSIIIPIIHMNNYECYLYGGADWVDSLIIYLKEYKVEVKAIIDADDSKLTITAACGVCYQSVKSLLDIKKPDKTFVIITPTSIKGLELCKVISQLYEFGIKNYYQLNSEEKRRITGHSFEGLGSIRYYRQHVNELRETYDLIEDETSSEVLYEYIRTRCEVGIYSLENIDGRRKYWYGSGDEEIYRHLEEEVWMNVGANIGDSIFLYFDNGLRAKSIYAFEGDIDIYRQLSTNLSWLPGKYRKSVHSFNHIVSADTEFTSMIKEKITLVNADIEGYELELIKAMKDIIVRDRPVIDICVYHRPDDVVRIPQYINGLVKNYHYIFRKYEAYELNSNRSGELVLYAVPDERVIR